MALIELLWVHAEGSILMACHSMMAWRGTMHSSCLRIHSAHVPPPAKQQHVCMRLPVIPITVT